MTSNAIFHRPSVLVVDDESVIADTVTEILKHEGYAATAAYDSDGAIEAALITPPQLVISDVMMPGVNGIELGIAIRRIFPDCKIILASGHSASRDLILAALSAGDHFVFLEKPVFPHVLLKHVTEIFKPDNGEGSRKKPVAAKKELSIGEAAAS